MIEPDAGRVDLARNGIGFNELGEAWSCSRSVVCPGLDWKCVQNRLDVWGSDSNS